MDDCSSILYVKHRFAKPDTSIWRFVSSERWSQPLLSSERVEFVEGVLMLLSTDRRPAVQKLSWHRPDSVQTAFRHRQDIVQRAPNSSVGFPEDTAEKLLLSSTWHMYRS